MTNRRMTTMDTTKVTGCLPGYVTIQIGTTRSRNPTSYTIFLLRMIVSTDKKVQKNIKNIFRNQSHQISLKSPSSAMGSSSSSTPMVLALYPRMAEAPLMVAAPPTMMAPLRVVEPLAVKLPAM